MGVAGVAPNDSYRAHATAVGNDTLLSFGQASVTLVGVGLEQLNGAGIVLA